jgi:hypothetical protein
MLTTIGGCVNADPLYSVAIQNVGTNDLENVQVSMGRFQTISYAISPGQRRLEASGDIRLTKDATVKWRTPNGLLHERRVAVKELVPEGFGGTIVFQIRSDNTVRVIPKSDEDTKRLADELRRRAGEPRKQ